MADTKIKDLTSKTPIVATDEFVINDAAGGNLDKKATGAGIKTFVKDGLVASDVTDFDTEVSNNTSVAANTAKTSNATHTGDVTGSTALTIAAKAVDVAMLADGTDGELITWSATGVAETVAVGTATHVLTSNGAGAAPTFQAAAGGGHTIEDEGTPLTARTKLNFVGTGVTVTDDAGDDATDVTISAGGDALTANPLSQFAQTTSLELKNTISDETGSGALVFATSPTLVTPALGTPASGVATNLTGTAAGLTAGNVTTNANLTGDVTSVGNASTIAADVIVNADINSAAAIALSKLATDPLARANHTGTQAFSTVTGTVPINQGGSGQTTAQAAIDALSAVSAATNEHVLTKDTGTGNAIWKVAASGFSDPMTIRGDIIYKNAGGTTTRLPAGGAGEVLTSDGTDISWDTAGSGDMVLASVQTVTGAKTFLDDKLLIQNPATTFEYTIQGGAITADRSLSLPVITASDTLTTLGLSQTFTDNNNFNNADVGGQSVTTFTNAEASVNSPLVQLRQARGSIGSETASLASDELGTIEFHGYGTSYESGAYIKAIANQNWAGPDHGTKMVLATTSDDQNTPAARLEISNAGHFDFKSGYVDMLEQSTPGNPTSNVGRLYVADNASTTTLYFRDSAGTETNLLHGARRGVQSILFDFTTDVATGDGKFYFHIDPSLAGTDLIDVHAEVITAGTTGTTDIQIHNVTQAADMLTTKLTIDSAETGSDTAAAAAVIDTANDDVAENDVIRIDVDAVSTTAAKGLIVTMGFRLP